MTQEMIDTLETLQAERLVADWNTNPDLLTVAQAAWEKAEDDAAELRYIKTYGLEGVF